MSAPLVILGVFFCGGLGSTARWIVHRTIVRRDPRDFPLGTFLVNVLGAFLLGLLFGSDASDDAITLAGTGFLGGFTTFSTWIYESERLVVDGHASAAGRNLLISSVVGFLAVVAGITLGRVL